MCDGDNQQAIVGVTENNLKREPSDAAGLMPRVDPYKTIRISRNARERDVYSYTEVADSGGTPFCIPIR